MPITGDAIAAALAARPELDFLKASATAEGAGTYHSLWKVAGYPPAGSNPPLFSAGSGYTNDDTRVGSWAYTNPGAGNNLYVAQADFMGPTVGTLIVYDRLWSCSGFGTVVTTAQNVTTPGNLPARDNNGANLGDGVEIWGEVYTAPGATGATWTATYVDAGGTSGRTATYTHPANAETVGQMFPFIPSADGVSAHCRQLTSFQASVSSGTAGDIGITLLRRLLKIPLMAANVATVFDWALTKLPEVFDDSCLALMVQCSTTSTGIIAGGLGLAELTP